MKAVTISVYCEAALAPGSRETVICRPGADTEMGMTTARCHDRGGYIIRWRIPAYFWRLWLNTDKRRQL